VRRLGLCEAAGADQAVILGANQGPPPRLAGPPTGHASGDHRLDQRRGDDRVAGAGRDFGMTEGRKEIVAIGLV
jgi:hypothetical protein